MTQPGRTITRWLAAALAATLMSGCATVPPRTAGGSEEVQILALNDFHGNIAAPELPTRYTDAGVEKQEPLGGAAQLGATLAGLRQGRANTITVAAGDLIGASPLVSAYYLDEPTILTLNRVGLQIAAVGNHEFDKGVDELRRMQRGGCDVFAQRQPCALDRPFAGASFRYLAANVLDERGQSLFPGTDVRQFGRARIGFIGMTLKATGELTSPSGTKGYRFADEAETANAAAEALTAQGVDAIVLLIHEGGQVEPYFNRETCPGLSGDILPILARLTPKIRLVVSGHTHKAYVCQVPDGTGGTRLLTSAGRYGAFVTDIRLTIDTATDTITALSAINDPVVAGAGEQADVAAIVARYTEASRGVASRVVGRVTGSLKGGENDADTPLARLVADAQLAATRAADKGGAQIAFINSGGVRSGFAPAADGTVTFGDVFTLQPFGNVLEVLELNGAQLRALLEQQFVPSASGASKTSVLVPSQGFTYAFDRTAPAGSRIVSATLDGRPIDPARTYRVTVNNFLANGGDGFTVFRQARFIGDGGVDVDALEAFIAKGVATSEAARVIDTRASAQP